MNDKFIFKNFKLFIWKHKQFESLYDGIIKKFSKDEKHPFDLKELFL